MKKKLLSILLGVCLMLTLLPGVALAYAEDVVEVDMDGIGDNNPVRYSTFEAGWNAALDTNNTANTTVKLLANWTAVEGSFGTGVGFGTTGGSTTNSGCILIPKEKHITLDLNGWDINRDLTEAIGDGYVIRVNPNATLILNDTSANAETDPGQITGGNNSNTYHAGGGVFVMGDGLEASAAPLHGGGTFIMEGGCITGNIAPIGGGVYVKSDESEGDIPSSFTMRGGSITNNTTQNGGGGVYASGAFTMEDGSITNNTAQNGGGVYSTNTFTMKGGSITNNTAKESGGGVESSGTFTMEGGSISGNESTIIGNTQDGGGGVYASGAFTMKGGSITNNTAKESGGGVLTLGTFTMEGGSITDNIANHNGGGVYSSGTFTMEGGSITNNTANYNGGGVMYYPGLPNTSLSVSGSAIINGNYQIGNPSNTPNNVYLSAGNVITVADALTSNESIGVTTQTNPGASAVAITGTNSADYSDHFHSDSAAYGVLNTGTGASQVAKLAIRATKPAATFSFDGADAMWLMGTTAQMKYSVDGGSSWTDCSADKSDLTGETITEAGDIKVKTPGDNTNLAESEVHIIDITKPEMPVVGKSDCTGPANNDGKLTGVTSAMEWTRDGSNWTVGDGSEITGLTPGTYYVRVKATGHVIASNSRTLTVAAYSAPVSSGSGSAPATVTEIKSEGSVSGSNLDRLISENKQLTVTGDDGAKLVLSTEALKGIDKEATGKVQVEIKDVSADYTDTLAGKTVFSLTVTCGGKTISDFGGNVTVSLPYELKDGEKAEDVTVWYLAEDGAMTEVPCSYDAETKLATFTVTHFSQYVVGVQDWVNPFADVKEADWFYGDVAFINAAGLMNGVDDNTFSPRSATTRGMVVAILYRLENSPAFSHEDSFSDIAEGAYYHDAVLWAAQNNIVDGYGDGKFGPKDPITREQMAAILYRYAQYQGGGFTDAWMFRLDFSDAASVSDWAYEAMCWCTMNNIIGGNDGALVPRGNAERCQVAAILHRFIETVK